jgi:hypothetical protein
VSKDKRLKGLLPDRFLVRRADGSSRPRHKHEHCTYFVLDWVHDPYALPAALAYADACAAEYPRLAADLRDKVAKLQLAAAPRTHHG